MAIIFMDGFDLYGAGISSTSNNTPFINSQWSPGVVSSFNSLTVATGGVGFNSLPSQCLSFPNTDSATYRIFKPIPETTTISVGCHFRSPGSGSSGQIFTLYNTNDTAVTNVIQVYMTSYNLTVRANAVYTTGYVMSSGPWFHIELVVQTTGRTMNFWIYVNEALVYSRTDNVQALSATAAYQNINAVSIGKGLSTWNSSTSYQDYDNFYISDAAQQTGMLYITPTSPSGDTVEKDWEPIPTNTTNYTNINDVGISASSDQYNMATAVGDVDEYSMPGLGINPNLADVYSLRNMFYYYNDTYVSTEVSSRMVVGGTVIPNTPIVLPAADNLYTSEITQCYSVNPVTSLPWQLSDIQSLRLGVERTV